MNIVIICDTIESYRRQQFKNTRTPYGLVVVVNSCDPTDDTASIAQDLGAKVIELAEGNVSKARNEGARHAEGELFIFNDADTRVATNYADSIAASIQRGAGYGAEQRQKT